MSTKSFIVDAFTSSLFKGNPAAVCVLADEKSSHWMQQVAAEFNLSETAFIYKLENNHWALRWFTPNCEVKLCGHATLAATHVLAHELGEKYSTFLFTTLSGLLTANITAEGITLVFPKIQPQYISKIYAHESGIDQLNLLFDDCYQAGEDILIPLSTENDVLNYVPELEKIKALNIRGLIITAASENNKRDFVSRFFAPRVGINEDPVTGSAHCCLAVFWSRRSGKNMLRGEQISARGGIIDMVYTKEQVKLTGNCITFLRGEIG